MFPNLFGLDMRGLEKVVAEWNEPAYRARQLYQWLYKKRVRTALEMTNLGKELRTSLAKKYEVRWPELAERRHSYDGTVKYLFRLEGGATIESVYIPEE